MSPRSRRLFSRRVGRAKDTEWKSSLSHSGIGHSSGYCWLNLIISMYGPLTMQKGPVHRLCRRVEDGIAWKEGARTEIHPEIPVS